MTRQQRRPSRATCPNCRQPVSLVDCGVPEHRRTRTLRERLEGRCPGRVYAHDATGGMECADEHAACRERITGDAGIRFWPVAGAPRTGSDGIEGVYGVREADEPPLCPCGAGYVGHVAHTETELRWLDGDR